MYGAGCLLLIQPTMEIVLRGLQCCKRQGLESLVGLMEVLFEVGGRVCDQLFVLHKGVRRSSMVRVPEVNFGA